MSLPVAPDEISRAGGDIARLLQRRFVVCRIIYIAGKDQADYSIHIIG